MKWVFRTLAVWVALVGIVIIGGAFLPGPHTAARQARYRQPASSVFDAISGFSNYPEWRPGVSEVEILPSFSGSGL